MDGWTGHRDECYCNIGPPIIGGITNGWTEKAVNSNIIILSNRSRS